MGITRKNFCGGLAGGSVLLLLQSCGGGGSYGNNVIAPAACGATAIDNNHGHTLAIPRADLDSPIDMSYSIAGGASHDHSVTFTVAELRQLKAGMVAIVTSTPGNAPAGPVHSHVVTNSCA